MNMMHDWGRPIDRRRIAPFQPAQPPHPLTANFGERLSAVSGDRYLPPYAHDTILPLGEAAWFFENPVNGVRLNLAATAKQRIQFFSGAAILMKQDTAGLVLTTDGMDALGRLTVVTLSDPIWSNIMRIARWMASVRS
jgi:hypothetical protein